jgi:RNA polymerase sigma factor for flagellar operon FliA
METSYGETAAEERERLILEHLPQVQWIAGVFHERLHARVELADLISTGLVGLIGAIDNFDPSYNACLRTYAEYKIRGAILDSIRGLDGVPPHKRKRLREIQDVTDTLRQQLQREPAEDEIATSLGVSVAEYRAWLDELKGVSLGSLDSVMSEGAEVGLLRYTADDRIEAVDANVEREQLRAILAEGIAAMPAAEQAVLDLYFRRELTLAEIGRVMDLHPSRICQIKTQAIVRLRAWMRKRLAVKGAKA